MIMMKVVAELALVKARFERVRKYKK